MPSETPPLRKFIPIKRTRKTSKVFLHTGTSKILRGELKARLDHLYIPPAYNNVYLAKSPSSKVQVIGEDVAGRKQYIYHVRHKAGLERRKYSDLAELGEYISQIEADNNLALAKLTSGQISDSILTKDQLIQIMIYMLRTYHFRIGNRVYAEKYGSHGLSTLTARHFKKAPNQVTIDFIGKKGVRNTTKEVTPMGLRIIARLLAHNKGMELSHGKKQAEFIYSYESQPPIVGDKLGVALLTSEDIQDFFKSAYRTKTSPEGIYVTPKMFRTWYANYHLLEYLQGLAKDPEVKSMTAKQIGRKIKGEVGEFVSRHLNNTPAICKKNYINNRLLSAIIETPKKYLGEVAGIKPGAALHGYLATLI